MNFKSPKQNLKKSVDYPIIVINSKPYTAELISCPFCFQQRND